MKNILLSAVCAVLLLVSTPKALWANQDALDIVYRYTAALASGDVEEIKNVLSGRIYNSRKVLIEQNTEYPNSLRSYYSGASFGVAMSAGDSEHYPEGLLVNVQIIFGNGNSGTETLILMESDRGNSDWRIVDIVR